MDWPAHHAILCTEGGGVTAIRLAIAEELLREFATANPSYVGGLDGIFAPCPWAESHTTPTGKRDFRVMLDGAPTAFCFHQTCQSDPTKLDAFNTELRRRIWRAEHGDTPAPTNHWAENVSPEPKGDRRKVPALDMAAVVAFTRGVPEVDDNWLKKRSPVEVGEDGGLRIADGCCRSAKEFLGYLYDPGERVLVFTTQWSQGDFLAQIKKKNDHEHEVETYRLAAERGVAAKRSALPAGGKEGVWFLTQPVTGGWDINPNGRDGPQWSRRFHKVVTAWRYYVLESDVLDAALWRRVVVSLPLPIAAIYTSGSRSIHALVREPVESKAQWDAVRDALRQIVCPLGADAGALSAVRLSRLPFCERAGTRGKDGKYVKFPKPGLQELLYLNPDPDHKAIRLMPERR
jgi:hypothetical protein